MFFNRFDEGLRKIFNQDIEKHNVMAWIIYNANYQNSEYEGLRTNECKFSYRTLEVDLNIGHKKMLRIIKELEQDKLIKWVFKSNSRGKSSIISLVEKEPVEEPVEEPVKALEKQEFEGDKEPVKEPVEEPSSINLSKNQSNIKGKANTKTNNIPVIDLTVNKVKIEKVRLTVDQYKSLVTDYSKSIIDDEVLNLDNYIINGKGEKYKDHNRVLRTWINRKRKDITQSESVQANKVYQRPL